MSTTQQQGGTSQPQPQQQQGQSGTTPQQTAGTPKPVIRDWAAI